MMQVIETEFKVTKIIDTMKGLPQAPSYFQKTVFQTRQAISNNMNGFLLKCGQICEHAWVRL